ncbi:hypothetical protein [Phyllobacterium chamaecytisi]|uniref:hypothetical protein n=1 Tax=Phyllobacterium chamaecytisi TaxID=2876082 RepID=UPI001CCDCE1E|nr:hypothetical protein [Phyllobacterium sp. KW56]MBZ9600687.1 hypothetical protein [Phyllobacterium sp. KW56]
MLSQLGSAQSRLRREDSAMNTPIEPSTGWEAFGKNICRIAFEGHDADGGTIQELGLKHGVLVEERFDRAKHKDIVCGEYFEDGMTVYVFAALSPSTVGTVSDKFATFRTGFCLQESGDGKHRITISYPTMGDMHKAFDELATALLPAEMVIEQADTLDGRVSQTVRAPNGVEYQRIVSADEAYEAPTEATFQQRVQPWMMACFGQEISDDQLERGDRLAEELFELLQSVGYPRERLSFLEEYTYSRPKGEPSQEVGGVMVTLAAFCLAHGLDMHEAGETELTRIWTKVEKIRAKQAAKPKHSPLPEYVPQVTAARESGLLSRLVKWDKDFPVNSYNGYAGLKELDKIIADARALLKDEEL